LPEVKQTIIDMSLNASGVREGVLVKRGQLTLPAFGI
jgi:hypothetical protein